MRRLLVLFLILVAMPVYCEGLIFFQDSTASDVRMIPVSDITPLPVDAEVSIGSITVEAFPVYADSTGEPATATVDADHRAVVNIGSETIGLLNALENTVSFVDASDDPTPGRLDANQRVLVNIGSDSIGLMGKLNELLTAAASETKLLNAISSLTAEVRGIPTHRNVNTLTIPGNTLFMVGPFPNNVALTFFNNSKTATLWVRSDGVSAAVGDGLPVRPYGFISFRHGTDNCSVMADEEMSVTIYLEGR